MALGISALAEFAAALMGERCTGATPLPGGDLSEIALVRLGSGREVVAKTGPAPAAEAAMLEAIRAAGAPAPQPLATDAHILVMERIEARGPLGPEGWRQLGAALRLLHDDRGGQGGYGWAQDYAFGGVKVEGHCEAGDWPRFWAERRLLPELSRLPADLARRIEILAMELPRRLPATPAAGLVHGDMWTGNVLAADGRLTALIDPACCRGDGEVDLAMLHLFGAPDPAFRDGYGPEAPGEAGRRAIYQLWPGIVHLRLFGAGYAPLVDRLLRAAGV